MNQPYSSVARLLSALFALLLVAALAPGAAFAKTVYVATNGNDNSGNGSSGSPYKTIQRGLDAINGGDQLLVRNGTYSVADKLRFENKSGSANARTVIKSVNRWGAKIRFTDKWGTFRISNSDYVTIDGFDIGVNNPGGIDHQGTGLVSFESDYVTYKNNFVHDCGCNGLSFREGDYVTIEQNVVRDNAKRSNYNCSGISIYQPLERNQNGGFHLIVRRNVAFENECNLPFNIGAGSFDKPTDGNGIILDDFANKQRGNDDPDKNRAFKQKTLVENNLVFNNGGAGIKVFDIDNATIRNNTSYHNLRILKNYSNPPAEIAVTFSPGIFEIFNNVAVARNDAACKALEYSDNYGYGYFNRQSNLVVGAVDMVSNTSQWGASNDLVRGRGDQGYPKFVNATTSIGSFSSVNDFDQYFRLASDSPANNSGDNGRAAGNDLEGRSRPDGNRVERGCYERASGTSTPPPTTTTSNQWAYRENLTGNWRNWSYGGNVTLRDGGIKKNGSYALKFQSTKSWGALSLQHRDGKSGSGLKEIRFWARKWKDNGNYTARFRVRTDNNNGLNWRTFQPTNSFQQFVFSRVQLGSPGTVRRMDINVPNGNTLWVDDLRLVYETSQLAEVELYDELAAPAQAPISVYPTVSRGEFDVELDVPARLSEVDMGFVDADGRLVDDARLPVIEGRNRMHFDMTSAQLAPGIYLIQFRSEDGSFSQAERVIIAP